MSKPKGERYTVAVDFDGVIHSYTSPWRGATVIPDAPVDGAIPWLIDMTRHFDIAIFTTRNGQLFGIGRWAVRRWLRLQVALYIMEVATESAGDLLGESLLRARQIVNGWSFPAHKPAALIYLDDRAYRFEGPGTFPTKEQIHAARPWNKR